MRTLPPVPTAPPLTPFALTVNCIDDEAGDYIHENGTTPHKYWLRTITKVTSLSTWGLVYFSYLHGELSQQQMGFSPKLNPTR